MRGLERFLNKHYSLICQPLQIGLVAQTSVESLQGQDGIVLTPIEAPVDDLLAKDG